MQMKYKQGASRLPFMRVVLLWYAEAHLRFELRFRAVQTLSASSNSISKLASLHCPFQYLLIEAAYLPCQRRCSQLKYASSSPPHQEKTRRHCCNLRGWLERYYFAPLLEQPEALVLVLMPSVAVRAADAATNALGLAARTPATPRLALLLLHDRHHQCARPRLATSYSLHEEHAESPHHFERPRRLQEAQQRP